MSSETSRIKFIYKSLERKLQRSFYYSNNFTKTRKFLLSGRHITAINFTHHSSDSIYRQVTESNKKTQTVKVIFEPYKVTAYVACQAPLNKNDGNVSVGAHCFRSHVIWRPHKLHGHSLNIYTALLSCSSADTLLFPYMAQTHKYLIKINVPLCIWNW